MALGSDRLLLEIRRSLKPFLMLLVLAALGITAAAVIAGKLTFARPWKHYHEVRAEFTDVKGIFPGGHQVRIHGVKVGIVSKADLVDHRRAVLTLKIDPKYGKVYKDAKLQIRPVTPLEDLYVNVIDRGHPSAGQATKSDVIPESRTVTPVDVSRVLDVFDADTRKQMTILLDELGKGLSDRGAQLRRSFAELAPFLQVAQQATTVLHRRQANVKRLVHNFGTLSAALADRDQDITRLVANGNDTLGELARRDQQFGGTLTSLSQLLPTLRSSMASVRTLSGHLDPALRSLKPVTDKLESGLVGLQRFGKDAVPALTALRPAVRDLRGAARTLPGTASALDTAFANLDKQAPQFDTLTRRVVPCLPKMNRFFQNTLSVVKYSDAYGKFPRADETLDLSNFQDPSVKTPSVDLVQTKNCATESK